MAKLKKILLMGVSYVLIAALSIGGTIAYLTSEDSDVNVMTLGNVKIEQHEYERAVDENGDYVVIDVDGTKSYKLQPFTQGKPALPIVGETNNGYDSTTVRLAQLGHNTRGGMTVFPAKNVIDKFVFVENTGKTDAYVRTIVAFEAGSFTTNSEWRAIADYSSHMTWDESNVHPIVNISGNNYLVAEFIYLGAGSVNHHTNGVLKPGDYTFNSLAQIYIRSIATNETLEALDGNDNGTLDVIVLSQAVQAAGFSDAKTALDAGFGEFNAENAAKWFGGDVAELPNLVGNATELQAAIDAAAAGNKNAIVFTNDIEGEVVITQPTDVLTNIVIDGQGHKYDGTIKIKGNSTTTLDEGIVIKNINFETETPDTDFIWSADSKNGTYWRYAHNITIENCTFTALGAAKYTVVGARFQQAYNIKVVNCEATGVHSLLQAESCATTVLVDGCKVTDGKNGVSFNNTMNAIIKNTEIDAVGAGSYGVRVKGEVDNYAITVENCNVEAFVPVLVRNMTANSYTATFLGTNTLTANNTYGYQVVFCKGDWSTVNVAPIAPTGNYTVTGVNGLNVFGK